jgi:hypothetical protein
MVSSSMERCPHRWNGALIEGESAVLRDHEPVLTARPGTALGIADRILWDGRQNV